MKAFDTRLRRISRIHRSGGGFEASGTLGQSYYTRQARRLGRPVLRPILYMLGAVITTKALFLVSLGHTDYAARVVELQSGTVVEKLGAHIMGIDPITLALAEVLAPLFGG